MIASLALHALVVGVPWCAPPPASERVVTEVVLAPAPAAPAESERDQAEPERAQPQRAQPQRAEPEPAQPEPAPPEPAESPPKQLAEQQAAPPAAPDEDSRRQEAPPERSERAAADATPPPVAAAPPPDAAPPAVAAAPPDTAGTPPAPEAPTTDPATPGRDGAAPVDLFPDEALARAAGPVPGEPTDERARVSGRIHAYVTEAKARERVSAGLVDPYFSGLRQRFERTFDPVWAHLDAGTAGNGIGDTVEAWARDYVTTADRYARTGSPYREGEEASDLYRARDRPDAIGPTARMGAGDSQVDLMLNQQLQDLWRDMISGKAGGIELLALVRVVQAPDGRLLKVELVQPSGREAYDEMVRRSVRMALEDADAPQRQGSGLGLGGEQIVSLWAFRTRFVVVPPVPMVGCDLNADLSVGECYHPLKKVVRSHLELEAVY